ncbi:MAG: manganese-binding transcriptional regulator MntR [Bdellovibrionales bacterium]|nr:manganese-binding transcriptional regulator MntR [Bdellovibrionales bacterium]
MSKKPKVKRVVKPELQAKGHMRTRAAHATELAEDYVEVISDLLDEHGEARVSDIAARIGVTHVTVTKKVSLLARDGLVTTKPYRSIFLTDLGREVARRSRERHQIVVDFLVKLGVPKDAAHTDAEGIEHHVSSVTLEAFKRFVKDEVNGAS